MNMRERIARWIDPELGKKADKYDWLVSEISHHARWLGEFPFMSRTLDRILNNVFDFFRPLGTEPVSKEPSSISAYRELLRREAGKYGEGAYWKLEGKIRPR